MTQTAHKPSIADLLATSATGWGVVIDGVLNIRTVTETANAAAINALCIGGFRILSNCGDPDCDCMVKALEQLMPSARVVPVKVEAARKQRRKSRG